jgi:hypothetical protein
MAMNSDQEYELEQQKNKWFKRAEFAFVQFLRLIFYLAMLLVKIVWGVIASILRGFGINVRG